VVLATEAIGRAGEYQAASIFELHGITTTHVDVRAVDLWVQTPSGRRVTVQVKASLAPRPADQGRKRPRYKFYLSGPKAAMADVLRTWVPDEDVPGALQDLRSRIETDESALDI